MNLLRLLRREIPTRVVLNAGADFGGVAGRDALGVSIMRGRHLVESVHLGPNAWNAVIVHADGSYENLGVSHNLLTTAGRDLIAAAFGAAGVNNGANVATGSSATSLTDTGEAWTTDQFKGWTIIAEESTNTPVYGNIGANSATVLTIDAWKNADDSAGTTPGTTANYAIYPTARARYMGLTADGAAASAADTVLASEQTGNGLGRALATYAHTASTATYTLQKSFSVSGSVTVHKGGLFTASNTTAGGIMVFEAVLNADAVVISGDTLTVTATVTLS